MATDMQMAVREPPMDGQRQAHLIAVGVDHTTAGIELRERLAFADADVAAALRRITRSAGPQLEQAAILSTCNRVELYGVARWRPSDQQLASFLAISRGVDASELEGSSNVYRDDQVVAHLAATAAGIHSLVLGEAQIQGQVRRALGLALTAGTAGTELRRLFECAVAAGRSVRANSAIGLGPTSVPYAAIMFARHRLGALSDRTVLLVGTGKASELVARHLVKQGVDQLLILSRVPSRAKRMADRYGGQALTYDQLGGALVRSDLVISATNAPTPLLCREHLLRAAALRGVKASPLVVIDLSVPRAVDPAINESVGVELHTVDDLRGLVGVTLMHRHAALPEAHAIVERDVTRFVDWLRRREAASRVAECFAALTPVLEPVAGTGAISDVT